MNSGIKFLADENFNGPVLRGVKLLMPDLEIVRVQDIDAISGQSDPSVLEWAAEHHYIVLTHDAATMQSAAYDRINHGLPMPGLFVMDDKPDIGKVIEELYLVAEGSDAAEWENQIRWLPFA